MLSTLPFTLPALRAAYADGVRPAQTIEEVFARLDAIGDPNIFICLCKREEVLAEAETLGAYGPQRPLGAFPSR